MRRLALATLIVLFAMPAVAQQAAEPAPQTISHGEFAVLLAKAMAGAPQRQLEPAQALTELQDVGLIPADWDPDAPLTHGELADIALRLGSSYTPADPASPVSRDFAEAFLRRQANRLRDYAQRPGHGYTVSHVLDQGVDRNVSPIDFP